MAIATVDLIIFGGVVLFLVVMVLFLKENEKSGKLQDRLSRVRKKTVDEQIEEKVLSLKREADDSLNIYGLQKITHALSQRLQAAGLEICVRNYVIACFMLGLTAFVMVSLFLQQSVMLGVLCGVVVGLWLPHFYVRMHIRRRQKQFLKLFPDAIDLIVRGLRAGLPVSESMQTVSEEISEPVAPIFKEMCDRVRLGVTMEKAMAEMADKLQMTEFNFFVISVTLQRETGGNLGEILSNLAEVLRQRHLMKLKIRAMSSEARASAYIVGALPFLVVLALAFVSPDYLIPLAEDFRGNIAAFAAFCSLSIGIFIMSRMAQFKI